MRRARALDPKHEILDNEKQDWLEAQLLPREQSARAVTLAERVRGAWAKAPPHADDVRRIDAWLTLKRAPKP